MCHYCGANLAGSSNGKKQDSGHPVKLNRGDSIQYCGNCSEKNFEDSVNQAMSSSPSMTSIGPTALLQSIDSSMSNYSDMSVDANFNDRRYAEDSSTDSGQEDSNMSREQMDDSNLPVVNLNGFHQTDKAVKLGDGDVDDINVSGAQVNMKATEASEMKEGADTNVEREISRVDEDTGTSLSNDEVDAEFWLPPEPEDQEDDIVGSVANYDDDDEECGDGITWAKSSSLDMDKLKERKLKAMNDVQNGKFRGLVSHLVKSVGVDSSGDYGKNWVDIVTSLSWEAAAFLKPDAQEGKAMDPDGYVKVKCIATGLRTQSRIIKGLVFKKHAAHKHMPTKYKNPRLLLINGSLDLSSSDGLSSFASMRQGKDNLKSIVDMIEMYHPNVVLVEKSVTRDIQESILAKGMTLVFDMKLHRLERVARCIGTPILSSEVAVGQHLRQCDSFHIEKFVEEHAITLEGGRKQSKTLMFLEGAPSRLGCTILLMGAGSNELKRIKCVVRCAVVMAYHLMLETSFLLDQSAMFSTISPTEVVDLALTSTQSVSVGTVEATNSGPKESETESNSLSTLDIPISNGYHETGSHNLRSSSGGNTSLSFEAYGASTFPGLSLSASIEKVMSDSFPLLSDTAQGMSSAVSLDGRTQDDPADNAIQIFGASDTVALGDDNEKVGSEEEDLLNNEQSDLPESRYTQNDGDTIAAQMQNRDEISSVLDSESILVLMSSRNGSRGTICEQRHFSHIKFYRSFDVPLGKFLRDNLLNQRLQCKTCAELPEAHFFYYAHHNKQLTIQVRRLPPVKSLPGAAEGKLWMWSRCGQCKLRDGSSKATKRVVISTDARGLSFGKFLELNFSNHSSFSCLSSCGHSFHKDFLHFFGLGPMVAMFKYSTVVTYSVSLPPQMVEFNSAAREDLLKKDSESVYLKGISMFLDIEKSLKDLGARFVGVSLNIQGSRTEFSDILEMLKQEKAQFEADIQSATKNGSEGSAVCKLLRLNKVRMELYLESCVWDRRLHALISPDLKVIKTNPLDLQTREHLLPEQDGDAGEESGVIDIVVESCDSPQSKLDTSIDRNDFPVEEIPINGQEERSCGHDSLSTSIATDDVATPNISGLNVNVNGNGVRDLLVNASSRDYADAVPGNFRQDSFDSSNEFQTDKDIPIATDIKCTSSGLYNSLTNGSRLSVSDFEKDKGWIWTPFTEIRREYMEDLRSGYLPKLDSSSSYGTGSVAQRMITDEGSRLHIPLGTDDYIVSDFEDEYSSIIACALTLLKDVETSSEDIVEDARREKGLDSRSQSSQNLTQSFSFPAPHWFSFGSSDGIRSPPSESYEDSHSSSFDGLDLLDKLVSYGASHPEVSMGLGKHLGKRKYSVVCLYASQFRQLRDRCCPSEVGYIASLSRCKNWDAKGGKSKSFFAKTLDDRFIIKEIKRTEFDSFMKFAPNYFEYMDQCYELGNQTCLAKILGIYQVVMRVAKNGKETKHDLLVMENLSFGRQIARQYDLKGALHARLTTSESGPGDVLLDQNFVNDMNVSPLYVSRKSKRNLQRAVYNDTNFLNSIHVMDYSLLVGVDTQRRELVCGIIDYLRQYTWDKQLENWVKSSLVVPKNQLPTIVSPKEYKKRFRKFIDTHFLSVPDRWCSQRSSNPCKLCGPVARDDSLHSESP